MSSKKDSYLLKILLLLLIACIVLAVGVTYGRYQSSIAAASFNVTAVPADSFGVFGGVLNGENAESSWSALDSGWYLTDDGAKLQFFVTNGDSIQKFSQRDRTYSIKIVSSTADDPLNVTLSYIDDKGNTMELPANPERIKEGSSLYDSYGEGWVYSFLDMSSNEVEFLLEGAKFSYRNFTLNVSGASDPSLINLIVTGNLVAKN